MRPAALAAVAASLLACSGAAPPPEPYVVELSLPDGPPLDPALLRVEAPATLLSARAVTPRLVELAVARGALPPRLRVLHPEACDLTLALDPAATERPQAALVPLIDLGPDLAQAGHGAAVAIEVRPGCRQALAGSIAWRVAAGEPLVGMEVTRAGFRVEGKVPARVGPPSAELPWGIVPRSPRTRGTVTLEATWTGAGRDPITRTIRISAMARASGVPSVAPAQRLLLGGAAFRVVERPGGAAEVLADGHDQTFAPDAPGRWLLADALGRELELRVGRHDETRLDCGRSHCHGSAAEHAARTRMTSVLARALEGGLSADYDLACALGCHAVGEPGLPDGGFAHVAGDLGHGLAIEPGPGAWERLPRPLRRLGGVGCTACHGPGAIPSAGGRWTILRSDVCAVCHDAPPRYGHVEALRRSSMGRSDATPEVRGEPCASCHTTSGFLAWQGARDGPLRSDAPPEAGPLGIACAACHAPHAPATGHALLREVTLPAPFADAPQLERSGVCVPCHAGFADGRVFSSAASLALGVDGAAPADGSPIATEVGHARVEGGCVGCHRGGGAGLERGGGHAFSVEGSACVACHAGGAPEDPTPDLHARARALLARLDVTLPRSAARVPSTSPHAGADPPEDAAVERGRARRDLHLVLEDDAAGIHGAAHARALLGAVEAFLSGP